MGVPALIIFSFAINAKKLHCGTTCLKIDKMMCHMIGTKNSFVCE
jgi:hypothetical protein